MKDVQINTVIRDSAANGLFNEIEELKKSVEHAKKQSRIKHTNYYSM